jgi:hypothetical protein
MNSFTTKYIKFGLIIFVIGIVLTITALSFGGRIVNFPSHNAINISESYVGVESLNIDLGLSEVEVKTGDEFKIEASNVSKDTFKTYVENGQWYIKDKMSSKLFNLNNFDSKITIYIPESFKSQNLKINIGAGSFNGDKLTASNTEIDVGAGNLEISNLTTDEIDIDCGVGNIEINGKINNKGNVKCGVGKVDLNLIGNEKDYDYDLSLGIGKVVLNNNNISGTGDKVIDNTTSDKIFKIDCGIGKVSININ